MNQNPTQNEKTWNTLSQQGVLCSRPKLDLTPETAYTYLNKKEFYTESLAGKNVLCLACGGGQQSIAFALLDAKVTVVDFSAEQLKKDQLAAQHYDQQIQIIQADMRDLSFSEDGVFDIVYQPYSINYVPSIEKVWDEVVRVLSPQGLYDLMFHNPYIHGSWKDGCWGNEWKSEELWEGKGYPIWQPYQDGYPVQTADPHWNFSYQDEDIRIPSPQEYRHTLSTIINGLINRGMEILRIEEETADFGDYKPGTWEHYKSCAPPWIYLLSKKKAS